jgi:hypothetical protein
MPSTKSKAKRWVNEAVRKSCEARSQRQPSSHLSLGAVSMEKGFWAEQQTIALMTA